MNIQKPYEFTLELERAVLYHLVASKKFSNKFITMIEADKFGAKASTLLISLLKTFRVKSDGQNMDNFELLRQELHNLHKDQKRLTVEEYVGYKAFLDSVAMVGAADGFPSSEAVSVALKDKLLDALRAQVLEASGSIYTQKGDTKHVEDIIAKIKSLEEGENTGLNAVDEAGVFTVEAFEDIRAAQSVKRLPTGIAELDALLRGGAHSSAICMYQGPSGSGKSMALVHTAASALLMGKNVLFISLELEPWMQYARLIASLTGVEYEAIENVGSRDAVRAKKKLEKMMDNGSLGTLYLARCFERQTTAQDVEKILDNAETVLGIKFDMLVIDYADLMIGGRDKASKSDGTYKSLDAVYFGLKHIAEKRQLFLWTAGQTKARKSAKERVWMESMSDSINKIRIAEIVISISPSEDGREVALEVSKNRRGVNQVGTGSLPHHFGVCQVYPRILPAPEPPTKDTREKIFVDEELGEISDIGV